MGKESDHSALAFIYCRISQDKSGAGLGVERQEHDCRELAERQGLTVIEVFIDNHVSAYSGKLRPAYLKMISRFSEVGNVIVYHPDRLHRSPRELEDYITASEEYRISTHSCASSSLDLTTSDGRFQARIHATISRRESEHRAERISRKSRQTIEQGRHTGGQRPFGWNLIPRTPEEKLQKLGARFEVNEREAEALRTAAFDYLDGTSMGSIVRRWNDESANGGPVRTVSGKPWTVATFKQVLQRPRNAGVSTHKGEVVAREGFPAILDRGTWLRIRDKISDNKAPAHYSNKAKYLLAGIARCHCGTPLVTGTAHGRPSPSNNWGELRPKVYRCTKRGAGHVGKRVAYADDSVKLALLSWFAHPLRFGPPALSPQDESRQRELEAERRGLESQEDQHASWLVEGVPAATVAKASKKLEERREEIDRELEEISARKRRTELAPDYFNTQQQTDMFKDFLTWHIDDRRDFVRKTFRVSVHPHLEGSPRIFDPHTVHVEVIDGEDDLDDSGDQLFYGTGERIGAYWPFLDVKERAARFQRELRTIRRLEAEVLGQPFELPEPEAPRPVAKWASKQSKGVS